MFSFEAEDVNQALQFGLEHLLHSGVEESSRNGPVLVAPGPVCTVYINPRARVLFSPTRDANPFFHFFEALWMLAGDNDIEFPSYFNSTYGQYSDDGHTMWDAYGWRWRRFFGWDQLDAIVEELKSNPTSRRCVLSMWNSEPRQSRIGWQGAMHPSGASREDDFWIATHGGKAVPCNTQAYFDLRGGRLNMTVTNRSNDAIWGCYGANAVHFSFLLEYMAMKIGVPVGKYYQFSNNLHVYTDKFSAEKMNEVIGECETAPTPDLGPAIEPGFDEDLKVFMTWARLVIRSTAQEPYALNVPELKTTFLQTVAVPMFLCWTYRKWKDAYSSNVCLDGVDAPDWQLACREWVERRQK